MAGENPPVRSFPCPGCRRPVPVRGLGKATVMACEACGTIFDSADPALRVIQEFQRELEKPSIQLGIRGTFNGTKYEVIGVIVRKDATGEYSWEEYLLMNPYKGFAWLVQSSGHWSFVLGVKDVDPPKFNPASRIWHRGIRYRHFLSDRPVVSSVLGEFYWEVSTGDRTVTEDWISPPYFLSREESYGEVSWSRGEYLTRNEVENAFDPPVDLWWARSVAMNQVNPWKRRTKQAFVTAVIFAVGMWFVHSVFGSRTPKLLRSHETTFIAASGESKPYTIDPFTVTGRSTNIAVQLSAPVDNTWIEADFDLVNSATGEHDELEGEVSFYSGSDSDGPWTEGSMNQEYYFTGVSAGTYQMTGVLKAGDKPVNLPVTFILTEGVPTDGNRTLGIVLLFIAPLLCGIGYLLFENARWKQSSHSGGDD